MQKYVYNGAFMCYNKCCIDMQKEATKIEKDI